MSDPVLPPAAGSWWDATATLSAVMHTLRLDVTDIDEQTLIAAIAAAAGMIDNYIDSADGVTVGTGPLQVALEQLAIELYHRKDAPFRQLGGTDAVGGVVIVPDEAIATVEPLIRPYRQRWAIA